MTETVHDVNGIRICAEVLGPDDGVPLLLVMGLGGQLVSWPQGFVDGLVGRGFRVVRFDNRDAGHSTHLDHAPVDLIESIERVAAGEAVEAPYTLSDMAADAAGLLDALGIGAAHLVGISMGGMIVQTMAIEQPQAVRSVTSIMSTTGDPDVGQPSEEAIAAMLVALRLKGETADELVDPSGGRRTAEAVPHAELVEIEGMGHNLPEALWPELLDHIEANTLAAV